MKPDYVAQDQSPLDTERKRLTISVKQPMGNAARYAACPGTETSEGVTAGETAPNRNAYMREYMRKRRAAAKA